MHKFILTLIYIMSYIINHNIGLTGQQGPQGSPSNIPFTTSNNSIVYNTTVSNYNFIVPNYTNTYVTGTEYKMLFDVNKGAFRVGGITTSVWDNVNLGNNSFASGFNNLASGANSSVISGLNNNVNSLNSSILMSITSTINNSNNSAIYGGTNNLINTSTNSHIVGSNCTVSGVSYSLGMGNSSTVNHNNAFVWSDSTSRSSIGNNTVMFGCAGGFIIDLGNNYGITITNNGLLPFTNNNTNLGTTTNNFTNLYLSNGLYSNNFEINDTTRSVMNYNGIINTPFSIIPNVSSLTLGSSSVGFANLYLTGQINLGGTKTFIISEKTITNECTIILNNSINFGSPTNYLNNVYTTTQIIWNDNIVVRRIPPNITITSSTVVIFNSTEITSIRSPAHITLSTSTGRVINTSGATQRWSASYESRCSYTIATGAIQSFIQVFTSTGAEIMRTGSCLCQLGNTTFGDVCVNGRAICEIPPNGYIQLLITTTGPTLTLLGGSNLGGLGGNPYDTTRFYIYKI